MEIHICSDPLATSDPELALLFVFSTPHNTASHRVGRVLSFISSRRNWDSPHPSPAGECGPPFGSGGRGTLAGERGGWESPNSDEGTYTVVLYIYMLFVLPVHRNLK
jgi:hypothetical protein